LLVQLHSVAGTTARTSADPDNSRNSGTNIGESAPSSFVNKI